MGSSRRRAALIALVVVVSAAVLLSVVLAAARRDGSDAATRAERDPVVAILIPGYGGGTGQLRALAGDLSAAGIDSRILDIGDGQADLRGYGRQARRLATELSADGTDVALIGYSAGGITARWAAQGDAGPAAGIDHIITLASPHAGTGLAAAGAAFGFCPPACRQLAPGAPLLQQLARAQYRVPVLSIYSADDDVVQPPRSAFLPGQTNLELQSVCAGSVLHGEVPGQALTRAAIVAFLDDAPLPDTC